MDFTDFWPLVEKKSWLPRIFELFWCRVGEDLPLTPQCITKSFSPKALERIFISFGNWNELDMHAVYADKSSSGESPEGKWAESSRTYYSIYWHKKRKDMWPLTRMESHDCSDPRYKELTLGQLMEKVYEKGGTIDVVVKVHFIHRQDLSLDPAEALAQVFLSDEAVHLTQIYEVFESPDLKD
jgi:hypothetical protein